MQRSCRCLPSDASVNRCSLRGKPHPRGAYARQQRSQTREPTSSEPLPIAVVQHGSALAPVDAYSRPGSVQTHQPRIHLTYMVRPSIFSASHIRHIDPTTRYRSIAHTLHTYTSLRPPTYYVDPYTQGHTPPTTPSALRKRRRAHEETNPSST